MSQVLEPIITNPANNGKDQPIANDDKDAASRQLVLGLVFGVAFGFLLQKGGVAKYHILVGQLLLTDFTVLKVMLSAVAVGMTGVYFLRRAGLVEYHLKPTRLGANTVGGLLFGAGFALSPYCPGTGAAAIGQGNLDAILMVLGMLMGSYLFAMSSGFLDRTVMKWGDHGELTIPDVLNVSREVVIAVTVPAIVVLFLILEIATVR